MSSGRMVIIVAVMSLAIAIGPYMFMERAASSEATNASFKTPRASLADLDWPMFMGGTDHTGMSPSEVPKDNTTLWTAEVPSMKAINGPVVYDGKVFVGSGDGNVRGLDIDTGAEVWKVGTGGAHVSRTVTAHDGDIYFGADNGFAYSFDIATGQRNWAVNLDAMDIPSSPTVAEGRVFIGTFSMVNAAFYALNASDGSVFWSLSMNDTENAWGFQSVPAYHDGRIFTADGWGNIYCLDPDGFHDGTNDGVTSESDPTLPYADVIWTVPSNASIIGSPSIGGGKLFIGTSTGWLNCLDPGTGSSIWKYRVGGGEFPSMSTTPAYDNGTVYTTSKVATMQGVGGAVTALDATTGRVKWRFNITSPITESSPVISDGRLFFGARNSQFYCIRTDDRPLSEANRQVWRRNLEAPITSTAAIAQGRVFVGRPSSLNSPPRLFAFGAPDIGIEGIEVGDISIFNGEMVDVRVSLSNNGTVPSVFSLSLKASTVTFKQVLVEVKEGLEIGPNGMIDVVFRWRADNRYTILVVQIEDAVPRDRNSMNDFDSMEIRVDTTLADHWTQTGAGPGMTGSSRKSVDSNRTIWEYDFEGPWTGQPESIWLDAPGGDGSPAVIGSSLFASDPMGDLVALTYPEGSEPTVEWKYHNSSVRMVGRPALLVDRDQTRGMPNKVFSLGDDGALWAFDWDGFRDSRNDGPFVLEERSGISDGDVLWRTPLPAVADSSLSIAGANVLIRDSNGVLRSYDDDTGLLQWTYDIGEDGPFAANDREVYLVDGGSVQVLHSGLGTVERIVPLSNLLVGEVRALTLTEDRLMVTMSDGIQVLDSDPDDNGDGSIDSSDMDEGIKDQTPSRDIIWIRSMTGPATPPAVDREDGMLAICNEDRVVFMTLGNGTETANYSLPGLPYARLVSGGGSFYVTTGGDRVRVQSYIGSDEEVFPSWSMELATGVTGEPAISGGYMYLSLGTGKMISLGAINVPPVAGMVSPSEGILLFPDEQVLLDGSSSYDVEGDRLTYQWTIDGTGEPLYEGPQPIVNVSIGGIGTLRLVLRVFDDMRSFSERSINVTVLKIVTYPDSSDFVNHVNVHSFYGISDPNGRGFVTFKAQEGQATDPRIVFATRLEFKPIPAFALYKFRWANISIGLTDKVFQVGMDQEDLAVYMEDTSTGQWVKAPGTYVDRSSGTVHGNFSGFQNTVYALGILDDRIPELRHRQSGDYLAQGAEGEGWTFSVEYRDADGDPPEYIRLVLDGGSQVLDMSNDGFLVDNRIFNFHRAEDVALGPGSHVYHFEAGDGRFMVRTQSYELDVPNELPVIRLAMSPENPVRVRQTLLFDASGTFDPDGGNLTFSWDFDASNGLQREMVGPKVSYVFYEVGVYTVTLTVFDESDSVKRNLTVTVIDDGTEEDGLSSAFMFMLLLVFVAILVVALIVFLVLTRKVAASTEKDPSGIGWTCPECGAVADPGSDECAKCGYEYDELDFGEE